jgi:hypothetical protein
MVMAGDEDFPLPRMEGTGDDDLCDGLSKVVYAMVSYHTPHHVTSQYFRQARHFGDLQ